MLSHLNIKRAEIKSYRIEYYLIPALVLFFIIIVEFYAILFLNEGVLTYVVDDSYIHLSLSKHIMEGWYGFNSGELSSPSSSIIWPFILAPFSGYSFYLYVPLILNFIFILGTIWTFVYIILLGMRTKDNQFDLRLLLFICLIIPALNFIGIIFIGMEHSLQVLLSVLLFAGLIIESRTKQASNWLFFVILLGPLIRYECLAFSIPAIIYLFVMGYRKKALTTFFVLLCCLLGFSIFLKAMGQPELPASVLSKSRVVAYGSLFSSDFLHRLYLLHIRPIFESNSIKKFILVFCIISLFMCSSYISSTNKKILAVLATGLFLHVMFGNFLSFYRYETYLYASLCLVVLYLIFNFYQTKGNKFFLYLTALLLLFSLKYLDVLEKIPLAANNIYQQQYQMRRFAVDFLKEPVAVNDIGLVSFNNPYYVLDLWGLGSFHTQKDLYEPSHTGIWMDDLARKYHIKLAMIYKTWFEVIPKKWHLLGCLYLGSTRISAASSIVSFYATDAQYDPALIELLNKFKLTLPHGVIFGSCRS